LIDQLKSMATVRKFSERNHLLAAVAGEMPLQRFLTYRLSTLTSKLNRQANAILAKASGLKLNEWRIIALLAVNGEMNGVRIAEVAGLDPGLLSRTLFALEEQQLVKSARSSSDRRVVLVTLTRQGRSAYDKTLPHMRARQAHLLDSLTAAERSMIFAIVEKLEIAADADTFKVSDQ
jgi:DNA-binding MarR family transcriptional regulator